ncbi:MAG: acetate--CoA ligase family protein [Candidatus Hodarchaeota archaeon]
MNETHFLHCFLNPNSIALYGANNKGNSLGSFQMMNLVMSGYEGKIFPIHLKLDSVMGYKAYKSIYDVPEIPDLVVIILPAKIVPQIFEECGEKGVKRIILTSGGFRELIGEHKNTYTEDINKIAKKYGIRFIGPNCLGVFNNWYGPEERKKSFNIFIWENLSRSKFSIASQSGTLSCHIWWDPQNLDLGLSRSLSVGNEANIDIVDCLEYYKDDKYTEIIGLYLEEIKRGRKFMELAKAITPKKPIIAIYGGGTDAGNRASQSHTGALSGNSKIYEGVFKQAGIIKTDYVQEFLDIALILSRGLLPKGNRLGIITNSGGPGAMIANNAEKHGLLIPEFSESLQKELKEIVPPTASYKNPLDCTFDVDFSHFYITLPEILMKSGEVDALIQYGVYGFQDVLDEYLKYEQIIKNAKFQQMSKEKVNKLAEDLIQPTIINSKKYSIPILYVNPMNLNSQWSKMLRNNGAILFKLWDRPVNALAKIMDYVRFINKLKN